MIKSFKTNHNEYIIKKLSFENRDSFFDDMDFMLESIFYNIADTQCENYDGGFYDLYKFTIVDIASKEQTQGKFMILKSDSLFTLVSENGYKADFTALAFSFSIWLSAVNNLLFVFAEKEHPAYVNLAQIYFSCIKLLNDLPQSGQISDEEEIKIWSFLD